ncbi:MAG: TRAP transporter large permease [Lautropia sp.]
MNGAVLAFVALFAVLIAGIPIGYAMAVVGTVAFGLTIGWGAALNQVGNLVADTALSYNLSVLPLFVLMGSLFARAGMAEDLYAAANSMMGHRRGGLAMATIFACGGFSAVSGSALACAATMSKVSVPVMRRYGYAPGFAAGTVAAGATLDILIPPSLTMVIYAIITEISLGKIMIAGFLPGLLAIGLFVLAIRAITTWRPDLGPVAARSSWPERLRSLRVVMPIVLLFAFVLGGIYFGVFSANEAAGIGAFASIALAVVRRRVGWAMLLDALVDAARISAMLFVVLFGSMIFANYVTISGATQIFSAWVNGFALSQYELIGFMLLVYVLLGCVVEGTAMLLLTVPILLPVVVAAGIDPIWFGIFVIIMGGVGLIHPPLGLLLFVVKAAVPDIKLSSIVYGVLPYLVAEAVLLLCIIVFPGIVTIAPQMLK